MKIEREVIKLVSLEDFADRHHLTLKIEECAFEKGCGKFQVYFKDLCPEKISSTHRGLGSTEEEAICNYAKKISSGTLWICRTVGYPPCEISVPRFKEAREKLSERPKLPPNRIIREDECPK